MENKSDLWAEQTQANYEVRQLLGVGSKERIIGDLPDEAFNHAVAEGVAKSFRDLDNEHGLENWYRQEEEVLRLYFCRKCGCCHYFEGSKIGEAHLKHRIHWAERALKDREFYSKFHYYST